MKNIPYIAATVSIVLLLFSCGNKNKKNSYLQEASGLAGEIIVVADSTLWSGEVGQSLKDCLRKPTPGVIRYEPMFKMYHVLPDNFSSLFKQSHNILIVSLDKNSSKSTLGVKKDAFAKNQLIITVVAKNADLLASKIKTSDKQIEDLINNFERELLEKKLYKNNTYKKVALELEKEYGFKIDVPMGYKVAEKNPEFIWYRHNGEKIDKSFFIAMKKFESQKQFNPKEIEDFRNEVVKKYMKGEKETTYMTTETLEPMKTRVVNLNGNYSVEGRGLWKLTNNTMGGSFISYTLADTLQNKLYYIEGFVYSPNNDKRESLRELETILWTFKPSTKK